MFHNKRLQQYATSLKATAAELEAAVAFCRCCVFGMKSGCRWLCCLRLSACRAVYYFPRILQHNTYLQWATGVCVRLRSTCVWVGYHLHTAHLFGMHINSPLYRGATAGQTLRAATKRRDVAMLWSQRVGRTRPQKNQNQLVNSSRGVQMKPRYLVLMKCGWREETNGEKQNAKTNKLQQCCQRLFARVTATHSLVLILRM